MATTALENEKLEIFKQHLKSEEKSKNTIEKYLRDICEFLIFIKNETINKETAILYKQFLIKKGYAPRSINSMIAAINCYLKFINRNDCKLKSLKIQKQAFCSENKELTKAEYLRLAKAADTDGNKRINLIIQTLCGTGIRVSELEFITAEAVKKGEATVSLKGKFRTVFIVKNLQKKLLNYIREQKITEGSVFITRTGKPISRTTVWREMKKLCESANVNPNKVFPHNLRHLFARTFYSLEKDIAKLADILGHSSINTTRIYIITTGDEHRRRMENMRLII